MIVSWRTVPKVLILYCFKRCLSEKSLKTFCQILNYNQQFLITFYKNTLLQHVSVSKNLHRIKRGWNEKFYFNSNLFNIFINNYITVNILFLIFQLHCSFLLKLNFFSTLVTNLLNVFSCLKFPKVPYWNYLFFQYFYKQQVFKMSNNILF